LSCSLAPSRLNPPFPLPQSVCLILFVPQCTCLRIATKFWTIFHQTSTDRKNMLTAPLPLISQNHFSFCVCFSYNNPEKRAIIEGVLSKTWNSESLSWEVKGGSERGIITIVTHTYIYAIHSLLADIQIHVCVMCEAKPSIGTCPVCGCRVCKTCASACSSCFCDSLFERAAANAATTAAALGHALAKLKSEN
jgi:hypothetical protein